MLRLGLPLALALACGASALAASPAPSASPARPAAPPAPPPAAGNGGSMQTPFYHIETDETDLNQNSGDFKMPHRVKFSRPGSDAVADSAQGNDKRGTVTLLGHVVVHDSGSATASIGAPGGGAAGGPTTLTCDRLEIDSKAKLYTAIGSVHFAQGGRQGSAQRGVLDRGSNLLRLEGGVSLTDPNSALSANIVNYNLGSKVVDVQGAPAVLKQNAQGGGGTDTVESAHIHYDQNSGDFSMPGKAKFSRPGTEASGDRAQGNTKRGTPDPERKRRRARQRQRARGRRQVLRRQRPGQP